MYRTEVRIFMCADAQAYLHVKLLLKLFILHENSNGSTVFFIKLSNVEVYVHPLSTSYIHKKDSDFNRWYAGMLTHTKKGVDNYRTADKHSLMWLYWKWPHNQPTIFIPWHFVRCIKFKSTNHSNHRKSTPPIQAEAFNSHNHITLKWLF